MCEEKWMNISKGISCIEDQKAILNYTINKIGKKNLKTKWHINSEGVLNFPTLQDYLDS